MYKFVRTTTCHIFIAVEEQGTATGEISRNVQAATQGTSAVSSDIIGLSDAVAETSQSAATVLELTREVASKSGHLNVEIDGFLTRVNAA